ncbi:MAG: 4-hydroxybenzoate octaprenyltransferase [Magnetococcales bacterium]|nr:4-hydroxybenzoate octaprenyltransferase [Magnetococcales bacterium]HIJ85218.1 4-hydroxybenzoate octaprenyltransferase [Magnetococcales bacterium]
MKHTWIDKIPYATVRESLLLMRVDRPVGIWLLLWPGLWSLMGASVGFPDFKLFIIIVIGTFLMRSAGCVANDLADRNIDPHVERTRSRPLARKAISIIHSVFLLFVLLFLALLLGLQLNKYAIFLCVPGAFLALSYPLTKRIIDAPQLYLGISFGWSVIIAWAAARNSLDWPAWFFFLATVFWATGYDTIYGMVDKKDDAKIGVRSTALFFGKMAWIAIGGFYSLTVLFWIFAGYFLHFSLIYFLFIAMATIHLGWQVYLVRNIPEHQLIGVFTLNQWTGGIVFVGLVVEKFNL